MKNFWSRYSLAFLRSLVYMLQQSEYNTQDYLNWFRRTHNFKMVARRKQLDMTQAAKGFFAFLVAELAVLAAILVWVLIAAFANGVMALIIWLGLAIALLLVVPYLLAYSIIVPLWAARALIQKPRERSKIARAKHKLAAHPATKIAIAGSYGKTTMKDLLATALSQGKVTSATPGNMNTPIGISRFVDTLRGDEEVLIFEMGEYYPGDIARLCTLVQPDIGIITGVNETHLVRFKTIEATIGTVFELADYLQDKPLYVNGESEVARQEAERRTKLELYSREGVGDWSVSDASTDLEGTRFSLNKSKNKLKVISALLGLHQVGPLATVAVIASSLGLVASDIEAGLAQTKPFEHRLVPTTDASGVTTIDDTYNGNPDGFKAAIDFLDALNGHRRLYVTPGIVELGPATKSVHVRIGQWLAASSIEVVILIETSAMPYIKEGLDNGGFKGKLMSYPDEITALMALPKLTVEGDVVLLQNDWNDQYA